MRLVITSIANAGDIERERVVLRAQEDIDLNFFAVFACRASDATFRSGSVPFTYWFPEKKISKMDYVVLYTKNGTIGEKELDGGAKSHFFYWRRPTPIWTADLRAVAVNTSEWATAELQPTTD